MRPSAAAALLLTPAAVAFTSGSAPPDDCDLTERRSAVVHAGGADRTRVIARAGSLRIEADPDLDQVEVDGTACVSDAELLERIRLTAVREGGEVVVRVELPETRGSGPFRGDAEARLDLVVRVPGGMALDVEDGSGGTEIRGAGPVRLRDRSGSVRIDDVDAVDLDDGSGGVEISGVRGDVRVDDGSGSLELRDVRGSIRLRDGSGSVRIDRVGGSVTVRSDGSGSIRVSDVRGDVRVEEDGSGSIRVARVGGDFVVERDGSGGIRLDEVAGEVRIPPGS